ncbi:AAA family ATPase [Puniceibacterium sediminis]|uniref:DNA repair exonuclease SbcCD ATPase subunit n=1 Tax=Puniceibacterium sediminis TaxID=1608407 RepID=A0A238XPD5_9RHOB|nr:AAA family ATPase [Puniceibacterium sediminis]SNR60542.1 DNA repair exonuclease SbcCD ATPase subunit [Puniceibacterium sediminis]
MKIRALTLHNVRKFGGKRVTIRDIGDGITVVSEANEFGKSTFFDALHAVFFEKHTATGKGIQSLRPHAGGAVRISADIDVDGARYTIEKRFLTQKGASVTDLSHGTVIARDGEAEDWLTRHIGPADHGPTGLLWVRQGVVGLEPADAKPTERDRLTEVRRDLLSSVAGEIDQVTGGRTMDRILRRCLDDLGQIATGKTLAPRGPWKEAVDTARDLQTELDLLERQCAELDGALNERRAAEDELRRLDDPAEQARRDRDVSTARAAAQAAESHAQKVTAAQRERDIATLQLTEATRASATLTQAMTAAKAATQTLTDAETRRTAAATQLTKAREAETQARAALTTAEGITKNLRDELALADRAAGAQRARDDIARLEQTLKQARAHTTARAQAQARIADNPATAANLTAAETAVATAAQLGHAAAARAAHVTIRYSGTQQLTIAGEPLPGDTAIPLQDGTEITMPGIGSLRFDLPSDGTGENAQTALAAALIAETTALNACAAQTLAEARQNAQTRQTDENAAHLADEMLRTLAPQGTDALEQALARARGVLDAAPETPPRMGDAIQPELDIAQTTESTARTRLTQCSEKVATARETLASAEASLTSARSDRDRADAQAGPMETRTDRATALAATATAAQSTVQTLTDALIALQTDAPDAATALANLKRAEAAFDGARKRRAQLAERRADLSARIDTRADEGIEERRDEVKEALETARATAARYEAEVAGLTRLRDALETARDGAREAYFEPVQAELRPLLRILHDDAGLDWESDSLMPGALRRGGEVEAFDTLSGGTQEQIAILTRLAFARLFARRGQHLPIILDDALVYSDDDRIVKMFTALNRVAADQQIIVFSCRQLAFAGLGGERPQISIEDAD